MNGKLNFKKWKSHITMAAKWNFYLKFIIGIIILMENNHIMFHFIFKMFQMSYAFSTSLVFT